MVVEKLSALKKVTLIPKRTENRLIEKDKC